MRTVTVLEALAEIKVINKKIESQFDFVERNLGRPKTMVDPLENSGGSVTAVAEAMQSIKDLQANLVVIRGEVNRINQTTKITVEGVTDTIFNWIVWKREVAPVLIDQYRTMLTRINQSRQRESSIFPSQRGGGQIVSTTPDSIIAHFDELKAQKEMERIQTMLERLDGIITLTDATVTVNIP